MFVQEVLDLCSKGKFIVLDESNTILHRSLKEETGERALELARSSEVYDPDYALCIVLVKEHRWLERGELL